MQAQVQPVLAFGAGIVSFLSPCIIPIIPSYMTFICGTSLQEMNRAAAPRLKVIGRTAFFALGFSLVFLALGLFMSGIGSAIGRGSRIISTVSGALIMAFGLNLILREGFISRGRREASGARVAASAGKHLFQSADAEVIDDSAAPPDDQDRKRRVSVPYSNAEEIHLMCANAQKCVGFFANLFTVRASKVLSKGSRHTEMRRFSCVGKC